MKLLHTSDWHLGKRLENFSRLEEQKLVLNEICEIAERENVSAILISGDLFDTFNPATEAVELFYKNLKKLSDNGKRAVIAIAGNHDSPERIEAPDPLARECGIIFNGFPNSVIPVFELESGLKVLKSEAGFIELEFPAYAYPLRILMTPYANELRLKTYLGAEDAEEELRSVLKKHWESISTAHLGRPGVNILMAHLLFMTEGGEPPEEPEEEKPILHIGGAQAVFSENIPASIQYTALGHLHRKQTIDNRKSPVIYSGSPLAYSFSEANQDKYVLIIDAVPGQAVTIKEIKLEKGKKLLRKRFEEIDTAVSWLSQNPDVFVELTLVSDTYLSAGDRKRLFDTHHGIVNIIPEIRNMDHVSGSPDNIIDLTKSMEELFIDFFKSKKGQLPDERILNIFKEVLSGEDGL